MRADAIKNFVKASYQQTPPHTVNGWNLDEQLSSPTALVYHDQTNKEAVVIHRGTKGVDDWLNNLAYLSGFYEVTSRYRTGQSVQKATEQKYGSKNVTTLSHSQGSVIARKVGSSSKQIININPAWLGELQQKNEYNVRSDGDVISSLYEPYKQASDVLFPKFSDKHNINIEANKPLNILKEHKSDVLERLGDKQIGKGLTPSVAKHPSEGANFHFRFCL